MTKSVLLRSRLLDPDNDIRIYENQTRIRYWMQEIIPALLQQIDEELTSATVLYNVDVNDNEQLLRLWIVSWETDGLRTITLYMCPANDEKAIPLTHEIVNKAIEDHHGSTELDKLFDTIQL